MSEKKKVSSSATSKPKKSTKVAEKDKKVVSKTKTSIKENKSPVSNTAKAVSNNSPVAKPENTFPYEVISGRLLTHYDETAGVALPQEALEQHRGLGNTVIPLVESYSKRYEKLRVLTTTRILPRREQLLQFRRQLMNSSAEVSATMKGIERETTTDAEKIIERLKVAESMRQSSIKHEILKLEEELEVIERIAKRVEQAREESDRSNSISNVVLTSAVPGVMTIDPIPAPKASIMIDYIQQYSDLVSQIEKVSSKKISVMVDFPTNDFPRETSERLEVISKCDRYLHACNVKDHMLWEALQENQRLKDELNEKLNDTEAKDEKINSLNYELKIRNEKLNEKESLLQQERLLNHEYIEEINRWAEISQNWERRAREMIEIMNKNNIHYVLPLSNEESKKKSLSSAELYHR